MVTEKERESTDRCFFLMIGAGVLLASPIIILSFLVGTILYGAWEDREVGEFSVINVTKVLCVFILCGATVALITKATDYWFHGQILNILEFLYQKQFSEESYVTILQNYVLIVMALSLVFSAYLYFREKETRIYKYLVGFFKISSGLHLWISKFTLMFFNKESRDKLRAKLVSLGVGIYIGTLLFAFILGGFVKTTFGFESYKSSIFKVSASSSGELFFEALYLFLIICTGFFIKRFLFSSSNSGFYSLANSNSDALIKVGKVAKKKELILKWRDLNHHIQIVGQPGSGKSVMLRSFYSSLILKNKGVMMIDLKADLDVMQEILGCAYSAQRLEDVEIIDLSNPKISCGYNPLLKGNATEIKDKIVGALEWSEPYYKKVAESTLLTLLRAFVLLRNKGTHSNLEDLYQCLDDTSAIDYVGKKVGFHDKELKLELNSLRKRLRDKEFVKSISGLKTDIELMLKSEFGEILIKRNPIDFTHSILNNKIVYCLLDAQTYGESSKRLARMLVSELKSSSGEIVTKIERTSRPEFTVIIDEFSDIVSNDDLGRSFVSLLNKCRGSGIGITIAHQSLGDFQDESLKRQILDSTETIFSFVQKDPESAEILSSLAGTTQVWDKTYQTETGFFGSTDTGRGSKKMVHEYIYHPNDFKNLDVGSFIYIAKKPSRHALGFAYNLTVPKVGIDKDILYFINVTKMQQVLHLEVLKFLNSARKLNSRGIETGVLENGTALTTDELPEDFQI